MLAREGIHGDTGLTMVQCYVPASGKTDITSFYYRFLRQCQQILTKRNLTHVVFHHDRYLTLVMAEYRKEIVDQVLALPEKYRRVVYLHDYEGYTAPEIAQILGTKENTVYTQLSRGRGLLRDVLGGEA